MSHDKTFRERGIDDNVVYDEGGILNETMTVRVSLRNNFTAVVCNGIVYQENNTWSEPAYLVVAGN